MTPAALYKLTSSLLQTPILNPATNVLLRRLSTSKSGDDDWNDAWESAWLPDDLSGKSRAPWESDVNFSLPDPPSTSAAPTDSHADAPLDSDTKAFVEDMNENWESRKGNKKKNKESEGVDKSSSLYTLDNIKRDYRIKKQRVHAGLWMKEIEKMEEAKFGDLASGGRDDIDKLLESCSEIFDSTNNDLNDLKVTDSEFKDKPDGWETTSKSQDGSIWEMSQREEDILLQEFERRIAFSKFQIASFIKTHIFSRRRPIDGWKYMIEEIGPNSRKGKGSVSRLPSVSDAATQPFVEEKSAIANSLPSYKGR